MEKLEKDNVRPMACKVGVCFQAKHALKPVPVQNQVSVDAKAGGEGAFQPGSRVQT